MGSVRSGEKVFGIGLSRTGTSSLAAALKTLGFKSIHWPHDKITQRELNAYYSGRDAFRFTVANTFDAVTDTPVASVYRELSHLYPEARFVLTVRDKSSWLDSCSGFFDRAIPSEKSSSPYLEYCATIRRRLYGRTDFDPYDFEAAYRKHVAGITEWFAQIPERLLIMDITAGESWEKLCAFLHAEIPDKPFPHRNRQWFPNTSMFKRKKSSDRRS
jgi:hypothetical protein